ncbi:MAG: hypothetical protein AB1730_09370 [Myxococcota bacterium]
MTEEREPQELLDAIADDPDALAPWRVLVDWLLEHDAPHALLAAYELKLADGTRDPELLAAVGEARRERAQLPEGVALSWGEATWRFGYITRLVVSLGRRYRDLDWRGFLAAPQLRMLQWLQLTVSPGSESEEIARSLTSILALAPPTLRRISVFSHDAQAMTLAELSPLRERPAGVKRVDLALGLAGRATVEAVEQLADAGYPLVSLDGTTLSPEGALQLREAHGLRLRFAGTGLTRAAARELDGPKVAWCAPDVRVALVRDTGALVPLTNHASPSLHHPAWRRRELFPTSTSWCVAYPARIGETPLAVDLQEDGQLVMLSGGLVRVLLRDDLDAAYRELLAEG